MNPTIVTVCYNSQKTVLRTIESVNRQSIGQVEHIFIDGGSTDKTVEIIKSSCTNSYKITSEPDNGIYDAMNKGFHLASGDFVGFLNSDDWLASDDVLKDVSDLFTNDSIDFVFGDIEMFDKNGRLARRWQSDPRCAQKLHGRQIPHPAFFVRASLLKNISGPFDSSYKISADLKQQLIIINKLKCKGDYIAKTLVNMSIGGASTKNSFAYLKGWSESVRAYNEVFGFGGLMFTSRKVFSKISGLRF
jgi:glycosyltransferase involved in cell wall biosynthesis